MKSVLSIAGSDSSGGAGIQADIKTIAAHKLFAQTAIAALTAQNTTGVYGVVGIDPEFVAQQIDVVFDDIRPDAVKIGMVPSYEIAQAIGEALQHNNARHVVVDPVMVATSGSVLAEGEAVDGIVKFLFPLAEVITPNAAEAEVLAGFAIESRTDQERAACELASRYGCAALVKGGHFSGGANDVLAFPDGRVAWFEGERIDTRNTHGTGCTLSSAIACGLAIDQPLEKAVREAKAYVTGALSAGLELGRGCGPMNHMWQYMR